MLTLGDPEVVPVDPSLVPLGPGAVPFGQLGPVAATLLVDSSLQQLRRRSAISKIVKT